MPKSWIIIYRKHRGDLQTRRRIWTAPTADAAMETFGQHHPAWVVKGVVDIDKVVGFVSYRVEAE